MKKTKPQRDKPTPSALARDLRAADDTISVTTIAERVSAQLRRPVSVSLVRSALAKQSSNRGRPRTRAPYVAITVRLPRAVVAHLDAWIARGSVFDGRADAVAGIVTAEVTPQTDWPGKPRKRAGKRA